MFIIQNARSIVNYKSQYSLPDYSFLSYPVPPLNSTLRAYALREIIIPPDGKVKAIPHFALTASLEQCPINRTVFILPAFSACRITQQNPCVHTVFRPPKNPKKATFSDRHSDGDKQPSCEDN